MNNYEYFKSIGLCPRCGMKKPFGNYKFCAECLEKITISNEKYRRPKSKMYDKRYAERRKQKREERKKQGLCTRCGKTATHGQLCEYHWRHRKELRKSGRTPGEAFRQRMEQGRCMYCGKPQVPGYKFCEECLPKRQQIARGIGIKNSEDSYERKEVDRQWYQAKLKHSKNT